MREYKRNLQIFVHDIIPKTKKNTLHPSFLLHTFQTFAHIIKNYRIFVQILHHKSIPTTHMILKNPNPEKKATISCLNFPAKKIQ